MHKFFRQRKSTVAAWEIEPIFRKVATLIVLRFNRMDHFRDKKTSLGQCLSEAHNFTGDELALITSCFNKRTCQEGDYLFHAGKVCSELFFVSGGAARITALNEKFEDITYFFIGQGQLCTILNSFNSGTISENSIQACCKSEILAINKQRLSSLFEKVPHLNKVIDRIHQNRLLDKIRLKNAYSGKDSTTCYNLFLSLQPEIANLAPLNHIASYLNITPQSLSRIRRHAR